MSQNYLLPCSCGQKLRVTAAQAGGRVTCSCGKSLPVPTLRGLRQLQSAPAEAAGRSAKWTQWHGLAFSGGLAIATVGAVLIAFFALRYARVAGWTLDRSDVIIAAESGQIDKLSPTQMLSEWSKLVEEGLGEQGKPIWVAAKEQATTNLWWIKLGSCAVAAGVLLAAATVVLGRIAPLTNAAAR